MNRDIFEAIRKGNKKIETRAATKRYRAIKDGDIIIFVCGDKKFKKRVKKVELFKSIDAILKKYKPETINPKNRTAADARKMWYSFPGYKEKIRKYSLVAVHLK